MSKNEATPYDPMRQYAVRLARKVLILDRAFHPDSNLRLSGEILNQLQPEDIAHADPV